MVPEIANKIIETLNSTKFENITFGENSTKELDSAENIKVWTDVTWAVWFLTCFIFWISLLYTLEFLKRYIGDLKTFIFVFITQTIYCVVYLIHILIDHNLQKIACKIFINVVFILVSMFYLIVSIILVVKKFKYGDEYQAIPDMNNQPINENMFLTAAPAG